MNKKPIVIIDTDPGHDDALALMLAIRSNKLNIKAITTLAGNADIQKTTSNARFILDLIGSKIPIFSGSSKPLKKKLISADVHGGSGLDGVNVTKIEKLNKMAVSSMIQIIEKNPNEVTIVCLGPETNLAKVIIKKPEISKIIKQVVIMGGAISVPGNKSRVAEFNIFADPDAAKIVFDSTIKKILVPLDACNVIPMFLSDFQKIKGELRKPILLMMKKFIKGLTEFENFKGALVYDALATYFLINPNAYKLEKMDIQIETKGQFTEGMSVVDKRNWGKKNRNVDVVKKIDRKKFMNDFINIMSD